MYRPPFGVCFLLFFLLFRFSFCALCPLPHPSLFGRFLFSPFSLLPKIPSFLSPSSAPFLFRPLVVFSHTENEFSFCDFIKNKKMGREARYYTKEREKREGPRASSHLFSLAFCASIALSTPHQSSPNAPPTPPSPSVSGALWVFTLTYSICTTTFFVFSFFLYYLKTCFYGNNWLVSFGEDNRERVLWQGPPRIPYGD